MVPESGIVLPWEQKAIRGEEIPPGLAYPDQVLYLQLRMLYAQKRMGIIDRDTAVREKRALLEEYRIYKFREEMEKEWVEVIRMSELTRAEFRKNPSVDIAWKLVDILEGRKCNALS